MGFLFIIIYFYDKIYDYIVLFLKNRRDDYA